VLKILLVLILVGVGALGVYSSVKNRDQYYEARLISAIDRVSAAISASAVEIKQVELFSPTFERGPDADSWSLTGIASLKAAVGGPRFARYEAVLILTCSIAEGTECWRMDKLVMGDQTLLENGTALAAGFSLDEFDAQHGSEAMGASVQESGNEVATDTELADYGTQGAVKDAPGDGGAPMTAMQDQSPEMNAAANAATAGIAGDQTEQDKSGRDLVFRVQKALRELGYDPGPADGVAGAQTVSAIMAFQRDHNETATGTVSQSLFDSLQKARQ